MYLSYEEYAGMGGGATSATFDRLEKKAAKLIDRATRSRLSGETEVRSAVKHCAYELIEMLRAEETVQEIAAGREIVSMSNDGVSVGFASDGDGNRTSRCAEILRCWLGGELTSDGVQLLYEGCDA